MSNPEKTKVDGYILPVSAASDYQTMSHLEKSQMMRTNPTVQYCTMSNGELGMYIPKVRCLGFANAIYHDPKNHLYLSINFDLILGISGQLVGCARAQSFQNWNP